MNVYRTLRDLLGGKSGSIELVDNGRAITVTPSIKPEVPLGFLGLKGTVQFAVIPDSEEPYADVTVRIPLGALVKKRVPLK